MGIGLGIVLIVIGAILSFAVTATVPGVDVTVIGYILMAAGALALVLSVLLHTMRAHTSHKEVIERREGRRGRDRYYDE